MVGTGVPIVALFAVRTLRGGKRRPHPAAAAASRPRPLITQEEAG